MAVHSGVCVHRADVQKLLHSVPSVGHHWVQQDITAATTSLSHRCSAGGRSHTGNTAKVTKTHFPLCCPRNWCQATCGLWLWGYMGLLPHLSSRSPCAGEQEKLSRARKPSDLRLFPNRPPKFASSPASLCRVHAPRWARITFANKSIHPNSVTPRCTRTSPQRSQPELPEIFAPKP